MSESTKHYAVDLTRLDTALYRATNSAGASIEFGSGEGLLSPVDVDVVTSRRAEPESFDVHVEGDRVNEDGASRLSEVRVGFNLSFPDTSEGNQARELVDNLIRISHEKDCTVSRTVENPTRVLFGNDSK